ncbi:MAG: hypothetical protein ACYCPS_03370 [Candidatus Saccharimonadales bacterium]
MNLIDLDPGLTTKLEVDRVSALCWQAREILGAFMLEANDLEPDENSPPPDSYEDDEADPGLMVHETNLVPLPNGLLAFFSNRPYILGDDGFYYPYPRPGYVTIHVQSDYDPIEMDLSLCDQIVFQVPHDITDDPMADATEPAIYQGFGFEEYQRIDRSRKQLAVVRRLLIYMRNDLLAKVLNDNGYWQDTYLSQTPQPSMAVLLEEQFGSSES